MAQATLRAASEAARVNGCVEGPRVTQCRASRDASPEVMVTMPALKKAKSNPRSILTIEGACTRPRAFTYHDLASAHSDYQVDDLAKVDERLAGKAVRLRTLIDQAGPTMHAAWLTVESEDGKFSASLPLDDARRTAVIVYDLAGKPLERGDGGPVRFIIPFFDDKCANVKGSTRLTISEEQGRDTRPSNKTEHDAIHADD
ncbi:MAG: hypothetical protein DHS20C15_08650 [Planctomycetota bacterium]|nr:MAG: hypothetical protein DHS20C15_08650 [Planctomycetota bacterium]